MKMLFALDSKIDRLVLVLSSPSPRPHGISDVPAFCPLTSCWWSLGLTLLSWCSRRSLTTPLGFPPRYVEMGRSRKHGAHLWPDNRSPPLVRRRTRLCWTPRWSFGPTIPHSVHPRLSGYISRFLCKRFDVAQYPKKRLGHHGRDLIHF